MELRVQVKKQAAELETYAAQAERLREARERWNLLDFKYQLLMDMVRSTTTCLDLLSHWQSVPRDFLQGGLFEI